MRSWHVLLALVGFATATCYYANKSRMTDSFIACGVDGFSSCCWEGETCLENGLCQEASGKWYRGPCDNPDWDGCYQACVKHKDDIGCCGENSAEYFSATLSSSSEPTVSETEPTVSVTESSSSKSTIYVTASPSSNPTVYVTASPDPSKPLPAGTITGIAMGGVVVLGSIGAIIWVLLRRRGPKPDAGDQGVLMQMQQPQVGSPIGPPNIDMAGVMGMGMGMGTVLGAAVVGVNTGENREPYMTEIHDGLKMHSPGAEKSAAAKTSPPVEIDDGVRMQPPVKMEVHVTTAPMQPHSQPAVRKDVFEV
ncbi:hypothetical protein BGZ61DRAFT_476344 [Ilyonectria robusta]|uniref:uncharacterized protein n=1 Tax=Ilyonectria robusta TaxID=1079257 RepID=UPI001E8E256D|nr:uncharacterized protein BGZ61DRAFT_476344 [Ilyonectria robusta]KAH8714238.1 hypothetical protein BGZ61DRAFT_476344 [Ilyonectria robusta]